MVEDSHAVDTIERLRREWEREHISLEPYEFTIQQILSCDLHSDAEVDSDNPGTPTGDHFRESTHTAAYIKDQLILEVLRSSVGLLNEVFFRESLAGAV
jgi:hypothetical protein